MTSVVLIPGGRWVGDLDQLSRCSGVIGVRNEISCSNVLRRNEASCSDVLGRNEISCPDVLGRNEASCPDVFQLTKQEYNVWIPVQKVKLAS